MNDIAVPNYDNVLTEDKLTADDDEISQTRRSVGRECRQIL